MKSKNYRENKNCQRLLDENPINFPTREEGKKKSSMIKIHFLFLMNFLRLLEKLCKNQEYFMKKNLKNCENLLRKITIFFWKIIKSLKRKFKISK